MDWIFEFLLKKVIKDLTFFSFEFFLKQTSALKSIKNGIKMTEKANLAELAHNYANTKLENNFIINI